MDETTITGSIITEQNHLVCGKMQSFKGDILCKFLIFGGYPWTCFLNVRWCHSFLFARSQRTCDLLVTMWELSAYELQNSVMKKTAGSGIQSGIPAASIHGMPAVPTKLSRYIGETVAYNSCNDTKMVDPRSGSWSIGNEGRAMQFHPFVK